MQEIIKITDFKIMDIKKLLINRKCKIRGTIKLTQKYLCKCRNAHLFVYDHKQSNWCELCNNSAFRQSKIDKFNKDSDKLNLGYKIFEMDKYGVASIICNSDHVDLCDIDDLPGECFKCERVNAINNSFSGYGDNNAAIDNNAARDSPGDECPEYNRGWRSDSDSENRHYTYDLGPEPENDTENDSDEGDGHDTENDSDEGDGHDTENDFGMDDLDDWINNSNIERSAATVDIHELLDSLGLKKDEGEKKTNTNGLRDDTVLLKNGRRI